MFGMLVALLLTAQVHAEPARLSRLVLAGPFASVSNPLIHMVESGALEDLAEVVEFRAWRDPDQLRLMALEGQADVLAMPVNVAANLYNRGTSLELLNVSVWGTLWMVSRDPERRTLADFRGAEIAMPFRGDMPDILFGLLAQAQGLNVREDLRLRYVSNPIEAMQLLVMRRVDHALLPEPAVSMAMRKARSFPLELIAPELHRGLALHDVWKDVYGAEMPLPQAGIALLGAARQHPALSRRIMAAYAEGLGWCQSAPEACGQRVARHVDMLTPEAIADAVKASPLRAVPAHEAQESLEFLFAQLLQRQPALLGGRLPDAAFYGGRDGVPPVKGASP